MASLPVEATRFPDALVAVTACRHGATGVTANRRDFELLARDLDVPVLAL